ncbi:TetR/AcrR family transcriptional regulator [Acholeplasma equirhinis]|uniref:TetR/AcrR family transcriptional regulator n=1 Tax=Acholeplasma equirhinis TaxID=555393 RepID=UPI00197AE373|nr:TetR/AcrR family transcriptional regulator [Acholeplasma equirhinis]MBN3490042.1 TetR/AcrR family transcriptional regulator [Acholeplasma equirhinis]
MTYEKFLNLKADKQEIILNAAYEVFSKYGYQQAPTDLICEKGGISKGALFHYFGNKENLFIYAFETTLNKLNDAIDLKSVTSYHVFDFLPYITMQKLKTLEKYPYMMSFLIRSIRDNKALLQEKGILDLLKHYESSQTFLYQKIDYSTLKNSISIEDFITWQTFVSTGFITMYPDHPNKEKLMKQLITFFDTVKENFSK